MFATGALVTECWHTRMSDECLDRIGSPPKVTATRSLSMSPCLEIGSLQM